MKLKRKETDNGGLEEGHRARCDVTQLSHSHSGGEVEGHWNPGVWSLDNRAKHYGREEGGHWGEGTQAPGACSVEALLYGRSQDPFQQSRFWEAWKWERQFTEE